METNQTPAPSPAISQEQMIQEIYENTRKTKSYMKWQLYITVILVVLPLLAAVFLVPFALSNLNNSYLAPLQGLQ